MNFDILNKYFASYSGIDGGNPSANIWICGIEYGGEIDSLNEPLIPESNPSSWTNLYKAKNPAFSTWQYHQKIAKLMVAIREWRNNSEAPINLSTWRDYIKNDLYIENGESFKLNLFPLSSPSANNQKHWSEFYQNIPDLENKAQYYQICRGDRFRFLESIRKKNNPKMLIGTGVSFKDDFVKAFGFNSESQQFKIRSGAVQRTCYRYIDGSSTLIVTPFFGGRYGVNSDGLIIDLAFRIAFEFWN